MAIFNQIVSGGGSAPAHYIEKTVNANGKLVNGSTFIDLTGVTDVGDYVLYNAYYLNLDLRGDVIFNVKKITGASACQNMIGNSAPIPAGSGITSFSSNVEVISGVNAFSGLLSYQSYLTSITLDRLVSASAQLSMNAMSNYCISLTSVNLNSLKELNNSQVLRNAFVASGLTELKFPAINTTSFTGYTNQFQNMLNSVSNVTLHFPSNVQSVIEGLIGYSTTTPFGAASGSVLFDLPATVILTGANSQAYERSPKDDTGTALAWRKQDTGTAPNLVIDWTPFYTNGTTDPAVSDTIYSDSACTTAVTTISSIA